MDSIPTSQAHIPVLCEKMVELLQPVGGTWIDCTAGAGGFTVALLAAGAEKVVAIDCDPDACRLVGDRIAMRGGKVTVVNAHFADFDDLPEVSDCGEVSGVVFDLGVSSMQLDQPRRGFSFSDDGPLDMRMSGQGPETGAPPARLRTRSLTALQSPDSPHPCYRLTAECAPVVRLPLGGETESSPKRPLPLSTETKTMFH